MNCLYFDGESFIFVFKSDFHTEDVKGLTAGNNRELTHSIVLCDEKHARCLNSIFCKISTYTCIMF